MKLQNFAKPIRYGNFCSFDLSLHNQRVQDGIARLANK